MPFPATRKSGKKGSASRPPEKPAADRLTWVASIINGGAANPGSRANERREREGARRVKVEIGEEVCACKGGDLENQAVVPKMSVRKAAKSSTNKEWARRKNAQGKCVFWSKRPRRGSVCT